MSNMPPQRFNYQQRVGREAGDVTYSFALTLCGTERDEYYFSNPSKITNEARRPYLDLSCSKYPADGIYGGTVSSL